MPGNGVPLERLEHPARRRSWRQPRGSRSGRKKCQPTLSDGSRRWQIPGLGTRQRRAAFASGFHHRSQGCHLHHPCSPPHRKRKTSPTGGDVKMALKENDKPVDQMTRDELAVAVSEFDQEFAIDSFGKMTPAQKERWERSKRKRGRPRVGRGSTVISVSIEKGLLKQADAFAKSSGMPRAKLISLSLRAMLRRFRGSK